MIVKKEVPNILILDTGKEWGGGTNSLLELLKRVDMNRYRFSALFYTNYKSNSSDIKTEMQNLGVQFLTLKQEKQSVVVKIIKELARTVFFFSKRITRHLIFVIEYQSSIKKNARRISGILRERNIDLLYMNNQPSSNLEGILASEMTNVSALQHTRIQTDLNSFEVKASNRVLSKIICVSEGVKETLIQQGIDPSRCVVVHNGISDDVEPDSLPSDIRKKWNIKDNDILIGTVGSLIKRKRIQDLIKVLYSITTKTDCPVKCFILGQGPEKGNLADLVKKKNLENTVIFTGFRTDAISFINSMDIFVMTSEKEGLPRVILEAMLMAKPVVAFNIKGNSELVEDGRNGILVPVGRAEEMADAVIRLVQNPELRKKMGDNGRKRVIDSFLINKYVSGVETVFAEILGK